MSSPSLAETPYSQHPRLRASLLQHPENSVIGAELCHGCRVDDIPRNTVTRVQLVSSSCLTREVSDDVQVAIDAVFCHIGLNPRGFSEVNLRPEVRLNSIPARS